MATGGFLKRLTFLKSLIPNTLVLGVLLGTLYWGHKTHWSFGHDKPEESGAHRLHSGKGSGVDSDGLSVSKGASAGGRTERSQIIEFESVEEVAKVGLRLAQVEERPMEEMVVANGVVSYDQTRLAQLSARVPGIVWRVERQVGQQVQKGDVLVLLDAGEVGRAKSEFLQSVVNYDLKEKNLARLRVISDSVPERAVREAEAQAREAKVRRFNAQQALINLGFPVDLADLENLSDEQLGEQMHFLGIPPVLAETLDPRQTTANLIPLMASFDGVVIGHELVVGEVVDPAHPQVTLADVSRVWITLNVDRKHAASLQLGQSVRFIADGAPREVVSRVSWISTEVDQKTRTIRVRAEVENPLVESESGVAGRQRLLRANTFGTGRICVNSRPRAVTVPVGAVHTHGLRRLVFVPLPGGRSFEPRDVRTGVSQSGFTEILEGVATGDQIVTTGSFMLKSELFGMAN
ncbi:MAG: efflux RND transporter periplasmic adaptor subunit [Planctomycetales bacterium]